MDRIKSSLSSSKFQIVDLTNDLNKLGGNFRAAFTKFVAPVDRPGEIKFISSSFAADQPAAAGNSAEMLILSSLTSSKSTSAEGDYDDVAVGGFVVSPLFDALVAFTICSLSILANLACLINFCLKDVHRQLVVLMAVLTICNIALSIVGLVKGFSQFSLANKHGELGELTCAVLNTLWMGSLVMGAFSYFLMTNEQRHCMNPRRPSFATISGMLNSDDGRRVTRNAWLLFTGVFVVAAGSALIVVAKAWSLSNNPKAGRHFLWEQFYLIYYPEIKWFHFLIELAFFLGAFAVPVGLMGTNYAWIYWKCVRTVPLNMNPGSVVYQRARRRRAAVVVTMMTSLVVFSCCNLPFHFARWWFLLFDGEVYLSKQTFGALLLRKVFFSLACMINLRTTINPILHMIFWHFSPGSRHVSMMSRARFRSTSSVLTTS